MCAQQEDDKFKVMEREKQGRHIEELHKQKNVPLLMHDGKQD